jgi:hypothetical protein
MDCEELRMAFKNEERSSGVSSDIAALRKVADEQFDNLIQQVRDFSAEQRINAGRNTFAEIVKNFQFLWDDTQTAFFQSLIAFINFATQIGCVGLKEVSSAKKEEVANYFQDVEPIKNFVEQRPDFFDYTQLDDENYQLLVEVFLCASLQPLISDYPNTLFTYMLLAACAGETNENGIKVIKRLREDYFDYAPKKKDGILDAFKGTLDKTIFMSPEEIKAADEVKQIAAAEAAKIDLEKRKEQIGKLKDLNVGDSFLFGSYPQSSRKTSESVEWIVLDKTGSKILVLSKYILDNQSFHKAKKTTPWSESLIRSWLDQTFIEKAFNDDEKAQILETTISEPGSDRVKHTTVDKVFLLSDSEVKKYLPTREDRCAEGTTVAGNSYWGLRSYKPGAESFQYYTSAGRLMSNKFGTEGIMYNNYDCTIGVRPAMWLSTAVISPDDKTLASESAAKRDAAAADSIKEELRKKETEAARALASHGSFKLTI